jgi:NDP-sugar pyrophosphorylase family protein
MQDLTIKSLFTVDDTLTDFINRFTYPWEVLPHLKTQLQYFVEHSKKDYYFLSRGVLVHESADVDYRAVINAPCVICKNVTIRPYAYLRGGVFLGENVTVGNSTEIKNSILFANCVVPHFNYVGDSILGKNTHFGAGVITSNLKASELSLSSKHLNHK